MYVCMYVGMVWYGMVWYGMYVCMYIYIYIYIYTYTYTGKTVQTSCDCSVVSNFDPVSLLGWLIILFVQFSEIRLPVFAYADGMSLNEPRPPSVKKKYIEYSCSNPMLGYSTSQFLSPYFILWFESKLKREPSISSILNQKNHATGILGYCRYPILTHISNHLMSKASGRDLGHGRALRDVSAELLLAGALSPGRCHKRFSRSV